MFLIVLLTIIGIFSGLLTGLLGVGGGIFIVPALAIAFTQMGYSQHILMHLAAGTSLAIMVFTAFISARSHAQHAQNSWPTFNRLLPGILVGTISGVLVANRLGSKQIEILFGLFLLFVAFHMFFAKQSKATRSLPGPVGLFPISYVIGFKSGLLGIGGGVITIPFLTYCNINMRDAVAVSAMCSFTMAFIGAMTAMVTGWSASQLPAHTIGYVLWPAVLLVSVPSMVVTPFAVRMSQRLPIPILKKIFGVTVFVTAIHMLWP